MLEFVPEKRTLLLIQCWVASTTQIIAKEQMQVKKADANMVVFVLDGILSDRNFSTGSRYFLLFSPA